MLFKRKAWKALEQEALAIEEADPQKALELLSSALLEAPADGAGSPRVRVLEDRVRVEERLGRTEEASADRREVSAALAPELTRVELAIEKAHGQALLDRLAEREDLLIRMGRPATDVEEARKNYLEGLDTVIAKTRSHLLLPAYFERRAALLGRMDRPVDAARTRLLSARVLRAFGGDESARSTLATDAVFVAKWGVVGFEMGDMFRKSYSKSLAFQALQIEMKLIEKGRAIALGRCGKCGAIVEVATVEPPPKGGGYDAPKERCPSGHKVKEFRFVVTEDREVARAELASQAR